MLVEEETELSEVRSEVLRLHRALRDQEQSTAVHHAAAKAVSVISGTEEAKQVITAIQDYVHSSFGALLPCKISVALQQELQRLARKLEGVKFEQTTVAEFALVLISAAEKTMNTSSARRRSSSS
eukprot:3856188-Pleurochrysis_carterae.AAC.1